MSRLAILRLAIRFRVWPREVERYLDSMAWRTNAIGASDADATTLIALYISRESIRRVAAGPRVPTTWFGGPSNDE